MSDALYLKQQQLTKLDPSPWLEAAWAQLSCDGKNLKSISDIAEGQALQARLRDGVLCLTVKAKEKAAGGPTSANKKET